MLIDTSLLVSARQAGPALWPWLRCLAWQWPGGLLGHYGLLYEASDGRARAREPDGCALHRLEPLRICSHPEGWLRGAVASLGSAGGDWGFGRVGLEL